MVHHTAEHTIGIDFGAESAATPAALARGRAAWRTVPAPLIAAAVTFAVFARSIHFGFVNWDDPVNFLTNNHYRGLGWVHLRWMLTTSLMGQWIPLTWLTLAIDYLVWGMDPFGYHLTNVLLHCAATIAWYFVARRLLTLCFSSSPPWAITAGTLAATLFFAIHPLRAESVAWITERRDVLSGALFMLALLGYLHAHGGGLHRRRWMLLSIGCYTLAALSKSIVVSLPIVLFLLDVYPLRRISPPWGTSAVLRLLREKWLYFSIALGTGLMAIWAQHSNDFLTSLETLPLAARIPVALYSIRFYFTKTLVPIGLSPLYELPAHVNWLDPRFVAAAVGSLAASALAIVLGRRHPGVLVAWMIYLVMLAPVSGVVHNGYQLAHDRYSYLSCLPWAVLFGAALTAVLGASQRGLVRRPLARIVAGTAAAWLVALGFLAVQQTKIWRDDDTLWRYALDADPACSICHTNLGISLLKRGFTALAIQEFERALALRPERVQVRSDLGIALTQAGRLDAALVEFNRVLARYPDDLNARNNLAVCLLRAGRVPEAIAQWRTVLGLDPNHVMARANLGAALINDGRVQEGVSILERLLADEPHYVAARADLVRGYLALERPDEAQRALEALRRISARAAHLLDGLFVATW